VYNYLIRRLLAMVPTLFFASIICFSVVRMVPGDILDLMLTENDFGSGDPKTRADLQVALGIDKPITYSTASGSPALSPASISATRCGRTHPSSMTLSNVCRRLLNLGCCR